MISQATGVLMGEARAYPRPGPRPRLAGQKPRFTLEVPSRGLSLAAYGEARRVDGPAPPLEVRWRSSPPPIALPGPWVGGFGFSPGRAWPAFGQERWVVPRCLVVGLGEVAWSLSFEGGPPLPVVSGASPGAGATAVERVGGTSREAWEALVARALEAIDAGDLKKVVLARRIAVAPQGGALEADDVVERLARQQPLAHVFSVAGDDGTTFLGASPELLCQVEGPLLRTEALAGTAPAAEGEALLASAKDAREHRLVVEAIARRLEPLVEGLEVPERPTLKQAGPVVHLHTPIQARLRPGVDGLQVARALHPTPAVAGTPREEAVAFLAAREDFDRGLYAGALGFTGARETLLVVGLRSARLGPGGAELYVGAGVVAGSTAQAEWLETQAKATVVLSALTGESG